jgi:putative NADPH-quinone reductase
MGHDVLFHDLYEEAMDPVMTGSELSRLYSFDERVQLFCEELTVASGLLIFHPDWWGQPPAILKGWVDRVFRQGVAYDLEGEGLAEKCWTPLLKGKKGLVFCTSDAPENDQRKTLETLWERVILGDCGMDARCHVMRNMRKAEPERRAEWVRFVHETVCARFPEPDTAAGAR